VSVGGASTASLGKCGTFTEAGNSFRCLRVKARHTLSAVSPIRFFSTSFRLRKIEPWDTCF
jgi:hypothetical protein